MSVYCVCCVLSEVFFDGPIPFPEEFCLVCINVLFEATINLYSYNELVEEFRLKKNNGSDIKERLDT